MNILTAGVEIVAPDGDIVFLVGASKKGVQVDSAVLKKASPVFATNLGEGPGLRARGENRFLLVELPDDNAETFIMIAKLIHGVRINPTLDEIFSISDSVEKYKFSSPFSAALGFDTWTESLASCRNTHSLWKLLVCAYNLELDDTFAATSQQLILIEQQGAIGELAVTTPDFEPSLKLACKPSPRLCLAVYPFTDPVPRCP